VFDDEADNGSTRLGSLYVESDDSNKGTAHTSSKDIPGSKSMILFTIGVSR
jgi:hypothetical protein